MKNEPFHGGTGCGVWGGGGDGVHILTGTINLKGTTPGDLLKVNVFDQYPRRNPDSKY